MERRRKGNTFLIQVGTGIYIFQFNLLTRGLILETGEGRRGSGVGW